MTQPEPPVSRRAARAVAANATQQIALPPAASAAAIGARPGFAAFFTGHPRVWTVTALVSVFLLLGTGSVFAGTMVGAGAAQPAQAAAAGSSPSATPTATPDPTRPVPAKVPAASPLRTCTVGALASDPRLLTFEGTVVNASTGEVLFDRSGAKAAPTASVLKVLTAAAALATLGPDARLTTKVVRGSEPGSIVLVGGGDPTLSAVTNSVYAGAPTLADLAAQTKAAWGQDLSAPPISKVILDSTLWDPNDNWESGWERSEQTQGDQPEVTALMVDGSRADPTHITSRRSNTPIEDAGAAFVKALGLPVTPKISIASAPSSGKTIAQVQSQPVKVLIGQMLPMSDNTLGEMLARAVSLATGGGGSSASLAMVIPQALHAYGIDTKGIVIKDGSGLSSGNAVPPAYVSALMAKILAGRQNLDVIYNALPVSGKSGTTLANRFTGASAVARGLVNAKTGYIKSARTLAGIAHSPDGTNLAFAFFALGAVRANAMTALDALTAGVLTCGNNLSNN